MNLAETRIVKFARDFAKKRLYVWYYGQEGSGS